MTTEEEYKRRGLEYKAEVHLMTDEYLIDRIFSRTYGCPDPLCLSCLYINKLKEELRDRIANLRSENARIQEEWNAEHPV